VELAASSGSDARGGREDRWALPATPRQRASMPREGRGVGWREPRVVVAVSYADIMQGRLRDPVLRALLLDDVIRP
jgi:hypothetical protein